MQEKKYYPKTLRKNLKQALVAIKDLDVYVSSVEFNQGYSDNTNKTIEDSLIDIKFLLEKTIQGFCEKADRSLS